MFGQVDVAMNLTAVSAARLASETESIHSLSIAGGNSEVGIPTPNERAVQVSDELRLWV